LTNEGLSLIIYINPALQAKKSPISFKSLTTSEGNRGLLQTGEKTLPMCILSIHQTPPGEKRVFSPKGEKMQNHIVTADVYESCFYILRGCTLEAVEGIPVNGKINCQLKFTVDNIIKIQAEYFSGKATVNLFEFRRTYSQVCSWIQQAKKQLKHQLQQQTVAQGGDV